MKNILSFLSLGILILTISSCTIVTSTNIPGKTLNKIPKKMLGNYELQLPSEMSSMLGDENKLFVTLESERMVTNDGKDESFTKLGDSLFFSIIGKDVYMSMGAAPSLTVYKVVQKGKDLELYSLFANEGVSAQQLSPYFSNVEEIPGELDENGEIGPSNMSVTIDDSKLASYFKSGLQMTDPFILKRTGSKKKK